MVPWNAYALCKVWNNEIKVWAAPWWAENSKEAYASGVAALASALDNFSKSRRGVRRGRPVGFPPTQAQNLPAVLHRLHRLLRRG